MRHIISLFVMALATATSMAAAPPAVDPALAAVTWVESICASACTSAKEEA